MLIISYLVKYSFRATSFSTEYSLQGTDSAGTVIFNLIHRQKMQVMSCENNKDWGVTETLIRWEGRGGYQSFCSLTMLAFIIAFFLTFKIHHLHL